MNCQQWLVVCIEFYMRVRAGAHYSLITRPVLHFQHLQWKKKKPPLPFTSGFHLRGDEADWRQLNHRESRESTSKISWFIHNFSPHECWYGDVSIWWDRSVEAGPGCLWCAAQRSPCFISSASKCFCLLGPLMLFSEDGRCVTFSFCRQMWFALVYITQDRNKRSRLSRGKCSLN